MPKLVWLVSVLWQYAIEYYILPEVFPSKSNFDSSLVARAMQCCSSEFVNEILKYDFKIAIPGLLSLLRTPQISSVVC